MEIHELDIDLDDVLSEVMGIADMLPDIAPDEFTVGDFAAKAGICYSAARNQLQRMVDAGKLTARKVRGRQGRNAWGYRITRPQD